MDILLIDDEKRLYDRLNEDLYLNARKPQLVRAKSAKQALQMLATAVMDAVLVDMDRKRINGSRLLARLQEEHPRVPVIVLSDRDRMAAGKRLENLRFARYLVKPVEPGEVARAVLAAVRSSAPRTSMGDVCLRRGRIDGLRMQL